MSSEKPMKIPRNPLSIPASTPPGKQSIRISKFRENIGGPTRVLDFEMQAARSTLGLGPSADSEDIKRQYRKLALKYHPDRNPGKELECKSKFRAIQAAYELLIDPHTGVLSQKRRPESSPGPSRPWKKANNATGRAYDFTSVREKEIKATNGRAMGADRGIPSQRHGAPPQPNRKGFDISHLRDQPRMREGDYESFEPVDQSFRLFPCPVPACDYHMIAFETEEERDRHYNQEHANPPDLYYCQYRDCAYRSKRKSNVKQHMEKAHGWTGRLSGGPDIQPGIPPRSAQWREQPPSSTTSTREGTKQRIIVEDSRRVNVGSKHLPHNKEGVVRRNEETRRTIELVQRELDNEAASAAVERRLRMFDAEVRRHRELDPPRGDPLRRSVLPDQPDDVLANPSPESASEAHARRGRSLWSSTSEDNKITRVDMSSQYDPPELLASSIIGGATDSTGVDGAHAVGRQTEQVNGDERSRLFIKKTISEDYTDGLETDRLRKLRALTTRRSECRFRRGGSRANKTSLAMFPSSRARSIRNV